MKLRITRLVVPVIAALLAPFAARAEDIDLFVANPAVSDVPNVLIILDNTANWNTAFDNEMSALANVLQSLPPDKFNIGVMLATETGGGNNNTDGGYVRAAIRRMSAPNLSRYRSMFLGFDKLNDKGNGGNSSLTMAEAYYYFAGKAPRAGNSKVKADYTGNTCVGCNLTAAQTGANKAVWALTGNAIPSKSGSPYTSPFGTGSCAKNFIIYISNGPNQENNSSKTTSNNLLAAEGGVTTAIPISPTGSQDNPSDEWARFMRDKSPLGVLTFTIDVNPPTTGQGPGWSALLKSMAGDLSRYTAVNSATGGGIEIQAALNRTFTTIQSVNSVFASVSLPLNVSQQGYYLNQVYVGMFRPNDSALPRWFGNLKQYRMAKIGNDLRLEDADHNDALNPLTGFLKECSRSYWTPSTTDSYWSFQPRGGCILGTTAATDAAKGSNSPDGNMVEKGGQAYVLRDRYAIGGTTHNPGTRNVRTCAIAFASCTTLVNFDSTTATQTALGAASTAERDAIISHARGLDVDDENANGIVGNTANPSYENRPSMHGDVIHSQPVAVNFGTIAAPKVLVFYGSNDGAFRAINGNRATDFVSGKPAGSEIWSFIPPEFFPKLKRLRDNTQQIKFPTVTATTATPKDYSIDGPVGAHVASDRAWIYAGMRRGGRVLYAFEALKSDPTNITLKWKRGCPNLADDTGCTSGFTGIGQTWSAPRPFKAPGYAGTLLVIGGGYDQCEDADPHTCSPSTKGKYIYVLDADTGALLATFATGRGVVAEISIVPDPVSGAAKFLYVADLGGNVYRVDTRSGAPASWSATRIAALGCDDANPCAANRKFMFKPDAFEYGGSNFIAIGSGDREKPLDYVAPAVVNGVQNKFFLLKDIPDDATWLQSETGRCAFAVICHSSLTQIASSDTNPPPADLAAHKGWALGMRAREQVVTTSITIYGVVTFSSHLPSSSTPGKCESNLGTARVYNINYTDASPANGTRSSVLPSDTGLPPNPIGGKVLLDDGTEEVFSIGKCVESALKPCKPPPNPAVVPIDPKRRVYWFIER